MRTPSSTFLPRLAIAVLGLATFNLSAATLYVSPESTNPVPPYPTWATAATNIQHAVDVAIAGDIVLVTNGIYNTGGRTVETHLLLNRVVIEKAIRLESVNGPEVTIIEGAPAPQGDARGNGDGAVRCVYLGSTNAVVSGFTLTNGHTRTSGDHEKENCGGGVWGGFWDKPGGVLTNCVLIANSASYGGGGARGGILYNCTVSRNAAATGGGASFGTLYNCTLTANYCTLTAYWSDGNGGGVDGGTLHNCTLKGNSAQGGGGVSRGTLYNCVVTGNSAETGGGAFSSTLYNSTVTGNSAKIQGGGVFGGALYNCIVYYNRAAVDSNYGDDLWQGYYGRTAFEYSCTTPLPPGPGNIDADPQLITVSHLSTASPCRGAGNPQYASGVDIDLEPWASPPSMGADEVASSIPSRSLIMSITAASASSTVGYAVRFTADNTGPITQSVWDFGDGTFLTNRPFASHAWTSPGTYTVRLTGYNESHPEGVSTTVLMEVVNRTVYYVDLANPTPLPPYSSWGTAATNIQDAINAGIDAGRLVLVANGVYTGMVLSNAVVVESLSGPELTVIDGGAYYDEGYGGWIPGVRCALLGDDSSLSGFTLTNGYAGYGAGVYSDPFGVVSNCVIAGNFAVGVYRNYGDKFAYGGGVVGGTLYSCIVAGNSASAMRSPGLYDCLAFGGGVCGSSLYSCTLSNNTVYSGVSGRTIAYGGGAYHSTLYNCTLNKNTTDSSRARGANGGGGAAESTLYNCTITDNEAGSGGGTFGGKLYNCTVTGNSARANGGGVFGGTHYNSIVYLNRALLTGANFLGDLDNPVHFEFSCATPLPPGPGNIVADPQLASSTHISGTSPCRGAGHIQYASGLDIDGDSWATPPSMGADEIVPGQATGPLSLRITADYTKFAAGYPVRFLAQNSGRITQSVWDFGDGTVLTNQPSIAHAWITPGNYTVKLTGYNESHPEGVSSTISIEVVPGRHYVNAANLTPVPPYTNWATAATSIQDAIDASTTIGRSVLVTNGVYRTGGVEYNDIGTNRIVAIGPMEVRSVNGPQFTAIDGGGLVRCAYLGNDTVLSGFTLTNGSASFWWSRGGGGVFCEELGVVTNCIITRNSTDLQGNGHGGGAHSGTLYNCVLTENSADDGGGALGSVLFNCVLRGNSARYGGGGCDGGTLYNCVLTNNSTQYGGGAHGGTLHNCLVTGNTASGRGGGASYSDLYNCTVIGNRAMSEGGGVEGSTLHGCIVYSNTAPNGANFLQSDGFPIFFYNSCTTPMPTDGVGNITADPRFVDAAQGDFRLRPDSPCIDAGTNLVGLLATDLLGLPRPLDGNYDGVARFDMGAYEFNPYRFDSSLNLSGEGFQFTIRGEPGKSVRIDRSRDLIHWEPTGVVPIPASGQTLVDPAATSESRLLYRAMRVP